MSQPTDSSVVSKLGTAASSMPGPIPTHPTAHDPALQQPSASTAVPATGSSGVTAPGQTAPTPTTTAPAKRKRLGKADLTPADLADRRQQVESRIAALEAMLDAAEVVPPTLTAPAASTPSRPLRSAARDIWYWVTPVDTNEDVPEGEIDAQVEADAAQQAAVPFDSLKHPQSEYLRCRLCLRRGITKVWVNRRGGVTGGVRDHLELHHPVAYYTKCREEGIPVNNSGVPLTTQPEFTRAGLVERLVNWIVINDQSANVLECPEFREVLLYCGQDAFKDRDVPHRDKLAAAAWAMYLVKKDEIDAEMKRARGRISLTSDLWSDRNLRSFMTATAHYINDAGELVDRLIAFRKIDGPHVGANLGQALLEVLLESEIADKIGCITLDNAGNNNTLMQELVSAFAARGIEFNEQENRIRCFPHVMNLSVSAILKNIKSAASDFRRDMAASGQEIDRDTQEYLQALESDPVEACRASVAACRATGMRREGFRQTIIDGNAANRFRLPNGQPYCVPVRELLRDMPIRWSSTYNMIKRCLELHPAIVEYSFRNLDAEIPVLTHRQYEVLQDILSVLGVAHSAQELLCAEKAPTLPFAFPVYESVVQAWELSRDRIPELSTPINAGISKIREYVNRTKQAAVHTLAMVVNPSLKFDWINEHWAPYNRQQAYDIVKQKMLEFQRQSYERTLSEWRSRNNTASQSQARGYLRVLTLGQSLQRASSLVSLNPASNASMSEESSAAHASHALPAIAHGRLAPSPADIRAHNLGAVEFELSRYISAGTVPIEAMGAVGLTEYWKANQFTYPLLYRIAMDVLPVQASSVSSERVFSSSKLTCTNERNRISTDTMEAFQVLKHSLYRRRSTNVALGELDFMAEFESLELAD